MATPNADRLHGIEEWRTSSIEHALDLFSSVTEELTEVADINREVSSDLGLEGGTADAACRILRTIAADMDENADSLTQIVNVSRDALQAGIQAKYESQAIQADLAKINNTLLNKFDNGTSAQSTPELAAYYKAQLDAAHAKIEKRATKTLTTLNGRALTAIGGLPFQDQIRAMLGRDNPGLAQRLRQHMEFGRTAPADNGRPPTAPTRSATDWRVSPDRSLGSPGSHTGHTPTGGGGSVGGGVSLQGAHYSPGRSAVVVPGSPTPHAAPTGGTGHGGHDPLLGLGLGGGAALGAGVAGFRAYQAARAARAAEAPKSLRSGAAIRSTPSASGSVLRGTNTARTPASPTASTAPRGAGRGDRGRPACLLLVVVVGVGEVVAWGDNGPAGRRAENTVSRAGDAQRRGHRPAQAHGLNRAGRKTRPRPNRTRRLTHNRNQFARSLVDPRIRDRIQDRKRLPRGRIDRDNRKHTRNRLQDSKREDGGPRSERRRLGRAKRFDEAGRGGAQRGLLAGRPSSGRQDIGSPSQRFDLAGLALPRTPNPRCGQKETRPGRRDGRDGLRDRQHRHLPRSRTPHHQRRRRHHTLNPSTNDAGVGTPHSAPTPTFTLERVPLRNRSPQRPGPIRGTHPQRHPKAA